jgi:hypothetical protein
VTKDRAASLVFQIEASLAALKAELGIPENPKRERLASRSKSVEKPFAHSPDPVLAIVNTIKSCEEAERIETEILNKGGVPGRVLLPFYICYKYFSDQRLTTGDVEKITSELRVKVKTSNVSRAISGPLQKYLEGDSTRVRGKAVRYKLNRKGTKYFEALINKHEPA